MHEAMAPSAPVPGAPATDFAPELDGLVAEAMAEWKVPGLAVAVVHDGAVVVLKAYGQRDIEAGLPVTLDTQFIICSITKTFTATGLALLVDERRLDWTRPVRDYVPEFRLHDDVATDRLTVRDLLCHHSGLPRHDWIWVPSDLTRAQMFAAMRYLEPNRDLRSVHQYSNLGYLVAGIVTERVSGTSWEEFIRTRLTGKLRMDLSFAVEDLARNADAAVPYTMDGDKRLRVPQLPISVAPAGGINASISDMANWVRFLLGGGEFEGQRLLSAPLVREMQTPRVHVATLEFSEIGDTHYGLGFRCHHYRGERAVGHSGGWIGWSTLMTLLPDRGIGVVLLTNRAPGPVVEIVTNFVLDRLLGKPTVPWFDRFRERHRAFIAQLETDRQTRAAARRTGTRPSHDLADYAGDYEHPGYGRIAITQAGEALHWAYRGMSATLEHRHYDTFDLPEAPERLLPDRLPITFATDREGNIARLSAPFEPLVGDIVFERVASGDCTEAAFRKACSGVFRHGPMTSVVAQDAEGQLTLSPANQPSYRLRPFRDGIFIIVELPGFRVEFRRTADGAVDELIFHQPNGTFLAQRVKDAS
jgi:CubicO group peptidase (beta-lactamase class C family)